MNEWSNWSGSLRFRPKKILQFQEEDQLCEAIYKCYTSGRKLKLAAAGHSSSPLVKTDQTLIRLKGFNRLVSIQPQEGTATFQSGMTVHEVNRELQHKKLALFNTGDVDVQTLAGAISTGTHGTGKRLQNLASMLESVRLINYKGEVSAFTQQKHPDIMRALRVSLGTLGIFTQITVRTVPLFKLHRLEVFTQAETCLQNIERLSNEYRNVDFYWYPRSDEMKIRIVNDQRIDTRHFSFHHSCKKSETGWVGEILPRKRNLKFDEMEFALDSSNGLECFRAVRERIKDKHRKEVGWRLLVRMVAKDDNYLSPQYGRDSITISLHHNAGLPFDHFFKDIEPIFTAYGGRPHWAKIHWQKGVDLAPLYPEWKKFQNIRQQADPEGFFMNDYLEKILI